jgi:hypothetical protein
VRSTSASLLQNLVAARAAGQVPDAATYQGLRDKLEAAVKSHTKGDHVTEWSQLQAFINQLAAQRGKGVSAATADGLTAFAKDLIASEG